MEILWIRTLQLKEIVFAVFIILLVPDRANAEKGPTSSICQTPTCIYEASQITNQMDSEVNPCNDFYKFVCGNAWKNSYNDNENLRALKDETNNKILRLCNQPIQKGEHIVLKTVKKLFQKCILNTSVENYLKSILEALEVVGGWPMLQGSEWEETKFDWLQATYKLREMGFPHSSFLNFSVSADIRNGSNYIPKISLPQSNELEKELISEVVTLLGADKNQIRSEIVEMNKFVVDMRKNNDCKKEELDIIGDYQNHHDFPIDWLEFINRIANPTAQIPKISTKDIAIFPQTEKLINWLNLLEKTHKRTQANYMVWKVLEELTEEKAPNFLFDLRRKYGQMNIYYMGRKTTQEENCLNLISKRFVTNPISIMYARQYVPITKIAKANELVTNIKAEFLRLLHQADWMDANDQNNATERMNSMNIMVGAPEAYYDDKILDEMNVDLEEEPHETFLSLILQVNKNFQSNIYKQINLPVSASTLAKWNRPIMELPRYHYDKNIIDVPLGSLQEMIFNDRRPNYLNYGSLGTLIGSQFVYLFGKATTGFATTGFPHTEDENLWSDKTKEAFESKRNCLANQAKETLKYFGDIGFLDYLVLRQGLGTKLSYSAYKKWAKSEKSEPTPIDADYTTNQLFWISSAHNFCKSLRDDDQHRNRGSGNLNNGYSHFVSALGMNNLNFAKDFNCPVGSNMNPYHKCNVF